MTPKRPIVILGGGLAGLAAANALAAFGIKSDVYEAAPVLTDVGAAIGTSPQAYKALEAIGLAETITRVSTPVIGLVTRNMQTGEFIDFVDNQKAAAKFGGPFHTFHRADILEALASRLDPASIHLGHRLAGLEERDDSVMLSFANGTNVEAEFVIGADGVRSIVRQALYGDDHPTYTGQMVWRALLKGSEVPEECLEPSGWVQWVGAGCHFMAYYMRGRELLNVVTQEDTEKWVAESWSTRGDPDEMRLSFPNPEPRLKTLLDLVTDCSKWGLFTRPLTDNWGRGRVQLIGDAAHAMLPNIGQGACQAFEDAYILARWLDAKRQDVPQAFRDFRRVRIPRVHAVQRRAEWAARFKHMQDTSAQKSVLSGKEHSESDMGWIFGFNPVTDWDKDPVVPADKSVGLGDLPDGSAGALSAVT